MRFREVSFFISFRDWSVFVLMRFHNTILPAPPFLMMYLWTYTPIFLTSQNKRVMLHRLYATSPLLNFLTNFPTYCNIGPPAVYFCII